MRELAKQTNAWACYDCGKCTASCPLVHAGSDYSPRRDVPATNLGTVEDVLGDTTIFDCLTCKQCDTRCPAEVNYTELVQLLRERADAAAIEHSCPHGGAMQSIMRMMAKGGTQQDRLGWLSDDLATDPVSGSVFLWTGCTPYYDAFFSELELATLDGTRAAVKLLNAIGIQPVVSPDERCCGHDLLWNGDRAGFEALARHNVELVRSSGATTVVTPCAECLRTWKIDYAPFYAGLPLNILHLTELVMDKVDNLTLGADAATTVTYQDPCRLGRHLGTYDEPRQLLTAVPGLELFEMPRNRSRALCCAGGTWSSCDRIAKSIQVDRLKEARATGSDVLVTACPKCQIHFRCAMKDPNLGSEISIEIKDVAEIVAAALE